MDEPSYCLHPVTDDHRAFLRTIAENLTDPVPRLVYADWLDEHGEEEEATRQRAWCDARKWLDGFASRVNLDYGDVISAGHGAAESGDWFTQYDEESARDEMSEKGVREKYWANWSIVTGVRVTPEQRKHTVFSCSC